MRKVITAAVVLLGTCGAALAQTNDCLPVVTRAPEIDASTAIAGLSLLAGAMLVLRARRKE